MTSPYNAGLSTDSDGLYIIVSSLYTIMASLPNAGLSIHSDGLSAQ